MRSVVWLFAACLALVPRAHAADSVDLTLVLVTDVSHSIDDSEFKLEKEGYAAAFTSRQVIEAIQGGNIGAIAVAYVEFASSFEVRTVLAYQNRRGGEPDVRRPVWAMRRRSRRARLITISSSARPKGSTTWRSM